MRRSRLPSLGRHDSPDSPLSGFALSIKSRWYAVGVMIAVNLATLVIVGSAIVCSVYAQSPASRKTQQPSLEDTEKWIMQTFDDDNTGRVDCNEFDPNLHIAYGAYTDCFHTGYSITLDSCSMTLLIKTWETIAPPIPPIFKRNPEDDYLASFSLRDIDPTTIRLGEPQFILGNSGKKTFNDNYVSYVNVRFGTTDQAKVISIKFPNSRSALAPAMSHECCDPSGIGGGIGLQPDYAPRFLKAFHHAVELCGGKPSVF